MIYGHSQYLLQLSFWTDCLFCLHLPAVVFPQASQSVIHDHLLSPSYTLHFLSLLGLPCYFQRILDVKQVFHLLPPSCISMPLTESLLRHSEQVRQSSSLPLIGPGRHAKVCRPHSLQAELWSLFPAGRATFGYREGSTDPLSFRKPHHLGKERTVTKRMVPPGYKWEIPSLVTSRCESRIMAEPPLQLVTFMDSVPLSGRVLIFSKCLPSAKFRCSLRQQQNIFYLLQSQA